MRKIFDTATAKKAREHILSGEHGTSQGVAERLHDEGRTPTCVHRTTVVRAAKEQSRKRGRCLKALRGKPRKLLNMRTKELRLKYCNDNKNRNWRIVLFSDRCRFLFRYPGCAVRPVTWVEEGNEEGDEREAATVNHPKCVNLYAGICRYGVTACHLVAGTSKSKSHHYNCKNEEAKNITSSEYAEVLKNTLLPWGTKIFGMQGISSWFLQQDNDPTHRVASAIIKEWNARHGSSVRLFEGHPPNSPDFNPIENVWGYVQAKVNEMGCKTFEAFQDAVLFHIRNVPPQMLRNLIASMPKRMEACKLRHGGKSGY